MGKYAKAVIATEIVVKKERRFFNHNRNTTDEVLKELEKILYLIFDYPHKHYTFKHFEV